MKKNFRLFFFKDVVFLIFNIFVYFLVQENIKIFHHNGCGPVPENCGNKRLKSFEEDRSLLSLHMDVEVLVFSGVTQRVKH